MKKLMLFSLLLLCVGFSFANENKTAQAFEEANKLYEKQDYAAAAVKYEQLISEHPESEALYFNLGNTYYKLRNVGLTVYNYEKALQLNPANTQARTNLKFAEKMRLDEFDAKTQFSNQQIVHNAIGFLDYHQWAIMAVVSSFLTLFAFMAYYFLNNGTLKRLFFIGILLFVITTVLSVIAAFTEKTYEESQRYGILVEETVAVKKEPRITAKNEKIIHEGTKVFIKETSTKWHKVVLPDLTEGYIEKQSIKEL